MLAVAAGLVVGGGPVGAALAAGHQSLTFALLGGLGGAALGLLWGGTAVALGERAERAMMAPAIALTGLPLALAVPLAGGLLGPERGLAPMAVVTVLIAAPAVAVIARDELRALLRREFLSAAQAAGLTGGRRLRRHILPNAVLPLAAAAWTALPRALMAESLASLLGLGLPEGDRLGNRHRRGGAGGRRHGAGRPGPAAGADAVGAARGGRRDAAGLLHDRRAPVSGSEERAPLRVEGLSLLTSRDILLDRLSFAVTAGEVLALSGGAGAGKTLLLRALAGLAPKGITVLGDIHIRGRRILVTQDGALDPLRTLGAQFVDLLACQSGMDERTALRCGAEALERFQVPAAARRLALHPHELGEAMRWRAALALAMAAQPALLLADSPPPRSTPLSASAC